MTASPQFNDPSLPPLPPVAAYIAPDDPLASDSVPVWLAKGLAAARNRLGQLLALQLIPLPLTAALWGVSNYTSLRATDDDEKVTFGGFDVAFLGLGLLELALLALVALAAIRVVAARAAGTPITVGQALKESIPRLPLAFGWLFVFGLLVFIGLILCVVPGIYLLAVAALVLPVVAVEGTNVFRRCFGLFHRALDAALGRALLLGLVCFGPLAVATIGLSVYEAFADLPEATGTLVLIAAGETLLLSVLGLVAGVLAPPLALGMYADLRGIGEPTSTSGIAADMGITTTSPG